MYALTTRSLLECSAIVAETAALNLVGSDGNPYDQYEFSVRLEEAGDCVQKVHSRSNHSLYRTQ